MPTSGLRAMPDLTCRARLCSSLALRTGSIASWHSKTCVSLTLTYNSCSSSCASAPLLGLRRPFMGIRFSYSDVAPLQTRQDSRSIKCHSQKYHDHQRFCEDGTWQLRAQLSSWFAEFTHISLEVLRRYKWSDAKYYDNAIIENICW